MSDRVVLDAAALDAINERLELAAWPGFTRISVGERDALIAAARENAALREALAARDAAWVTALDVAHGDGLLNCDQWDIRPAWPDGDDGAGIMHGVDW